MKAATAGDTAKADQREAAKHEYAAQLAEFYVTLTQAGMTQPFAQELTRNLQVFEFDWPSPYPQPEWDAETEDDDQDEDED